MASAEQTQQTNVVNVAFEDGMTAVYAATSGSVIQFAFDTDNVVFGQQGEDLIITNAHGDVIVIDNYVALAEAGTPPHVLLDNGVEVAGDVFLFSVGHEETAAGAAASGGGLNDFHSDPGSLLNGAESAVGHGSDSLGFGGHSEHAFSNDSHSDFSSPTTQAAPEAPADPAEPVVEPYHYPEIAENNVTYFPVYTMGHTGNSGNNSLIGSFFDDTIHGNGGHDLLWGDQGNDYLDGGSGNDLIFGGEGNDTVYGGGGYDTITLGEGHDVLVFNADSFQDGSAIVTVNDFTIGEDGVKLEDGVTIEAVRDYGTYTEAVLSNGTDDHVIVRLLGDTRVDFDAHINTLGDSHAYTDTEQLIQYMAGNDNAWV